MLSEWSNEHAAPNMTGSHSNMAVGSLTDESNRLKLDKLGRV